MSAPPYDGEGAHALWHVSEDASISRFEPREGRVWAIDTRHLPLYWFPRDCPRATFWAVEATTGDDADRFLGGDRSRRVHVIEPGWVERMRTTRVVAYRLPEETFEPWDRFFISAEPVDPVEVVELGDLDDRHAGAGIELQAHVGLLELWERRRSLDARLQRDQAPERDTCAMRILVAEDETIIRLDLRDLLERAGFEVCAEARDGEEAVALARSERPDLAIMDVKMPRLDGIEAARRILDENPIPIVMLTAYGQEELVSRAVEAGVFGYLVKPFREQDLLPAIHAARARHDELQALRAEAESLGEALAARKVIERAKGLLMAKENLNEQEAFERLRKASQVSQRPLKVIAEAVVATLGDET